MQALAEKTGFLEATLENTGAGIAAFDVNGSLIMSNQLFDEFIKRFDEQSLAQDKSLTLDRIQEVLSVDLTENVAIVSPDGNAYELRRNVVPSGGDVVFILDITEQKNLERTMIQARNDAQAASRAKSAFLSNISHELRTPLHSIIGYSELILTDTRALDPKDCAGQINESGNHLLKLIESVLAFSKLESGEYSSKSDRIFELDGLMTSSIAQVAEVAARRAVVIDYSIDPSIESIFGDQMALRQILVNLMNNAIEFSEEDGRVDVELAIAPEGRASLSVTDHGAGMDPAKVERAFIPFVQLDDSLDRSHEGTGLGLPIVKSLAEHHEAEISVKTELGSGTSVSLTLPSNRVTLHDISVGQVGP